MKEEKIGVLPVHAVRSLVWVLVVILLAGCSRAGSGSATERPSPEATLVWLDAETPSPTANSTVQPGTSTPLPSAVLPTGAPTGTPQLEEVAPTADTESSPIVICSPLSIHPLEELPEIISDPYRPPPPGKEQRHHGVDFSYYRRGDRLTIQGVGVQSVLPGVAAMSLAGSFPYGNVVIIETQHDSLPEEWIDALHIPPGYSIYTLYAHMDQPSKVVQGESVGACQPLGEVGLSGNAAEPHLHLEMRLGAPGVRFDSMGFYKADDTEEERSNYVRWRTSGDFMHFDPMLLLADLIDKAEGDQ